MTETSEATIALNKRREFSCPVVAAANLVSRVEARRACSETLSTVSSPTLTTTSDGPSSAASSTVSSPTSTATSGRHSLWASPSHITTHPKPTRIRPTTRPRSLLDTTKGHGKEPHRDSRSNPRPLRTSPLSPKRTLSTNTTHVVTTTPPASYIEIPTDSDEEPRLVVLKSNPPSQDTPTPTNHEGVLGVVGSARERNVSARLPPSLAAICLEDSTLSHRGEYLRHIRS